ncbi:hypothetical protein [uncultured Mediterranean phage]|nr:hypothetical protein [uncultured Mediterranean phage]
MTVTVYCDETNQVRTWYRNEYDAENPSVYTDLGWVRWVLPEALEELYLQENMRRNSKLVITDGVITDIVYNKAPVARETVESAAVIK